MRWPRAREGEAQLPPERISVSASLAAAARHRRCGVPGAGRRGFRRSGLRRAGFLPEKADPNGSGSRWAIRGPLTIVNLTFGEGDRLRVAYEKEWAWLRSLVKSCVLLGLIIQHCLHQAGLAYRRHHLHVLIIPRRGSCRVQCL